MNREQRRARERRVNRKYGKKYMEAVINGVNESLVINEVNRKCEIYQKDMIESMTVAMKKNGISSTKIKFILDDFEIILRKKVLGVEE